MATLIEKRISCSTGCMKSLYRQPGKVKIRFLDMLNRYMSDPSANGLNMETVEGAKDSAIKLLRVDKGYRAIAFEVSRDIMFVHVDEHDKAYRWARNRRVKMDIDTNRVRIFKEQNEELPIDVPHETEQVRLFANINDERLSVLGVLPEEIPAIRELSTVESLEASEDNLDSLTFQVLYGLAAGYSDEDIRVQTGVMRETGDSAPVSIEDMDFSRMIETDESRQTIFISDPENQTELRRFLEGSLDGWRVFLHPEQRKIAYRDYNGPAMVRGGAGTGKTVVAMHRAKYLADQVTQNQDRARQRILFTTFTTSLAHDIKENLKTLCPEYLDGPVPLIEVVNLDRWVSQFLKRKNFKREVAFFGESHERLEEIWETVFSEHEIPEGLTESFVKAEWKQIIQAKGLLDRQAYLMASRVGRGTALNRRKRAALWKLFESYRIYMLDEGLVEPDDAYREAVEIIKAEGPGLPYFSVVVDEAQDMGEQAFRLLRQIIPENPENDRNSLFIAGDAHQRIYGRKASMSSCGINIRGRSRRLRLNYRTTGEIRKWAVSVLEGVDVDDLDDGIDTLKGYVSLLHGSSPELAEYACESEELDGLEKWVHDLTDGQTDGQTEGQTELSDIAVLCANNRNVDRVAQRLKEAGIDTRVLGSGYDDRKNAGVRVATMYRAKGLEFFAVAIPFMSDTVFPSPKMLHNAVDDADREDIVIRSRSLLHVAATRAKKALRVSWSGEPSKTITS